MVSWDEKTDLEEKILVWVIKKKLHLWMPHLKKIVNHFDWLINYVHVKHAALSFRTALSFQTG